MGERNETPIGPIAPATGPREARGAMAQVLEVPELESWFLLQWRDPEHPDILMEFQTQDEAEQALAAAFAELAVRLHDGILPPPMRVYPVLTMLEDPTLRDALAAWDAQMDELTATAQRTISDVFPGTATKPRRERP
jgi:hypothetical protein